MSLQVSNHIQMAISSCPISTSRSAMDAMSSQVSNHIQMPIPSCHISTTRSAVNAMRPQLVDHIQMTILSCRSEEHTSELQSLMRISSAFFCLKTKITHN